MPYTATVTVNNVVLPDGHLYQSGNPVALSDADYAQMGPALRAAVLTGVTPVGTGGGSYKGAYSSGTTYAVGDTVTAHSQSFVATAATTGHDPLPVAQLLTGTPGTVDGGDGGPYEMGVKFTAAKPLLLTGVAFYKAATNTGTHTASLWQFGQNQVFDLVSQVAYTGETASGFQTAPLQAYLEPGTVYMASVAMPSGHYSLDQHVFDAAVTVGSVTAPIGAGMYNTVPGHAPNTTPGTHTSYWVSPVWGEPDAAHWQTLGEFQFAPAGAMSATELAAAYVLTQIGANGGIAGLDGTGRVTPSHLPVAGAGTATVLSGQTSVTVTHGLPWTPTAGQVQLTPGNGLGTAAKFWVDTLGATTFTVHVDADPGATTAIFNWAASLV